MLGKAIKTEAIAGLTTFFTMSYIIFVNPLILSSAGTGMNFQGVLTATVLLCFLLTLLMGLYAKLPFAVAPGMGVNAFFTYTVVLGKGVPWPIALGMVFWSGVLFLLISATPLREQIAKALPKSLRVASAAGIGLFLTFIGLKNAGLVTHDAATFVKFGGLTYESSLACLGIVISALMLRKKSPFAFLTSMLVITVIGFFVGRIAMPTQLLSWPDFESVFLKLNILDAMQITLLPTIFAIMLTDLFDSISTFVGISHAAGLVDEKGEPKNLKQGLVVDAIATLGAGLLGTSSGTAYIESAAGIEVGGRTGLTAVFAAFLFLPFLFIGPLVQLIPIYATAPVLVIVGGLMFRSVSELRFESIEESLPSYLTIVLIPLTFSITQGILWGFISYVVLHFLVGKARQISVTLYGLAALSLMMLYVEAL